MIQLTKNSDEMFSPSYCKVLADADDVTYNLDLREVLQLFHFFPTSDFALNMRSRKENSTSLRIYPSQFLLFGTSENRGRDFQLLKFKAELNLSHENPNIKPSTILQKVASPTL